MVVGTCLRLHSLILMNLSIFKSLISIGKHDVSSASLTLSGFLETSKYSKLKRSPIADGKERRLLPDKISFRRVVPFFNLNDQVKFLDQG